MTTTTYVGIFQREGDVWEADARDVPGVHTFGKTLAKAQHYLRDALALWFDVPLETVDVEVQVRFDKPDIEDLVHATIQARRQVERDAVAAARLLREAATQLVAAGLSYRDAGIALGVSHQRIDQLIADREAS
jgi:predicted RNase H-like HicB family nuclease